MVKITPKLGIIFIVTRYWYVSCRFGEEFSFQNDCIKYLYYSLLTDWTSGLTCMEEYVSGSMSNRAVGLNETSSLNMAGDRGKNRLTPSDFVTLLDCWTVFLVDKRKSDESLLNTWSHRYEKWPPVKDLSEIEFVRSWQTLARRVLFLMRRCTGSPIWEACFERPHSSGFRVSR